MTLISFNNASAQTKAATDVSKQPQFRFMLEQFADLKIMRYKLDGFDKLSLNQKKLVYYLYQSAL
jgi:dipeptidyl-peptidase-3